MKKEIPKRSDEIEVTDDASYQLFLQILENEQRGILQGKKLVFIESKPITDTIGRILEKIYGMHVATINDQIQFNYTKLAEWIIDQKPDLVLIHAQTIKEFHQIISLLKLGFKIGIIERVNTGALPNDYYKYLKLAEVHGAKIYQKYSVGSDFIASTLIVLLERD